MYEMQKIDAK